MQPQKVWAGVASRFPPLQLAPPPKRRRTRAHLFLLRVVRIGLAILDQLDCHLLEGVKVVGRVRSRVGLDPEEGEVLDDGLLELGLHTREREGGTSVPARLGSPPIRERTFSLLGLVSSKRTRNLPSYMRAKYWFKTAACVLSVESAYKDIPRASSRGRECSPLRDRCGGSPRALGASG